LRLSTYDDDDAVSVCCSVRVSAQMQATYKSHGYAQFFSQQQQQQQQQQQRWLMKRDEESEDHR